MDASMLHEIFERSLGRELTVAMMRGMLKSLFDEAAAAGRDLKPAYDKLDALVGMFPLEEATTSALRVHLTDDEITSMLTFYRSPLGGAVARFGIASAETVSNVLQSWTRDWIVVPALAAAGVSREEAASHGLTEGDGWRPADWQGVDATAQANAREIVRAMEFDQRVDEMIQTQNDGLANQGLAAVAVAQSERDRLSDRIAEIYARAFTAPELVELVAFYRTPFGRRFVELTPLFGKAGQAAIDHWTEENPGALEERVAEIVDMLQ